MQQLETSEEILNFAIRSEYDSASFYTELASRAKNDAIRELFEEYAAEEKNHASRLEKICIGTLKKIRVPEKVIELHIADYLTPVSLDDINDMQDAMILAMKREKAAQLFYTALSESASDPVHAALFKELALEEGSHLYHFESEYDEHFLQ